MALVYTDDIMSALYDTGIAADPNYEVPGNFGLTDALVGAAGVDHVTVTNAGTYTTVPTVTAATGAATFSARMKLLGGSTVATAGTGYVPGDVLSLSGGTKTTTARITVATVKLVSATIAAGGTGYGNAQTFTATVSGGTAGTTAQISVTSDSSGVITTINSVSRAGSYTVVPTSPAATTGGSGTGLTVNLVWGINTFAVTTPGVYSALPASPISMTGGGGSGGQLTGSWGVSNVVVTSPGSYSSSPPVVNFSSGTAAATAVLASSQFDVDTQKLLLFIEILRSYVAEANNTAQVKQLHEVMRKMMAAMRFGGPTTFDASDLAERVLSAAMLYFARNAKHNASV